MQNEMHVNDHQIRSYDAVLDAKYGKEGSPERERFRQEAEEYYASLLLLQARREVGMTQAELASRAGTTKSYISKIENGVVQPSVGLFLRLIDALGLRFEITKPIL